ncbi:MAG TPA: class I SAM-dependent methyltransferase [Candidatus Binatia bacterium]|nr:class I SAM-dependent methyltransferase [Candidatus Binatia bacterium]
MLFRRENFDPERLTLAAFSSRKLPEYMHFRLMRCRRCDLVYATPVPSPETLAAAYRTASFEASKESEYAARTYVGCLARAQRLAPVATLDIGAGDGAFLRELQRRGFDDLIGFEPSEAPVRAAADDIRDRLRVELFDGSSFPDETFGLVTCFQTIEHVYEPLALVKDIHRVLRPGGTAFLIGHNVDALSAKLMGAKSPIFDVEHMQLLNRRSAATLMREAGFREVSVFPILNAYPLAYWAKLFPMPARMKARLLDAFAGSLRRIGDATIPLPAGNLAILAIK